MRWLWPTVNPMVLDESNLDLIVCSTELYKNLNNITPKFHCNFRVQNNKKYYSE